MFLENLGKSKRAKLVFPGFTYPFCCLSIMRDEMYIAVNLTVKGEVNLKV
jgi:hypothetical protein